MFNTRQQLENLEAKALAPYGFLSKDSRGRAYTEDEPQYRTAFSAIETGSFTRPHFAVWNSRPRSSLSMKAITTEPV